MTSDRTVQGDGLEIFYREAGEPGSPKLLLLHGFPASSHQYRELLAQLDDRFHMVSVDYPGFGLSSIPDPATWEYTFDRIADAVDRALNQIGFTGPMGMYLQDYGGPIGNRLTTMHPDWLQWQVIQNANSYEEGFTEVWGGLRAFWGQGDLFFTPAGGEAYLRDLPRAKLHRLHSGRFCLEDCLYEIAYKIVTFYDATVMPIEAGLA